MNNSSQKIGLIEKIGYSLGDLAANLIFQTLMTFLAFFYTDVYGIEAGKASAIIFTGGMIGALFNPFMGMIADRTNTRWGKFRPWILWTAIPFCIMAILAFRTPDFSMSGKIVYAFITYLLLVIVYSANNLPYAALSGVLTGDMAERNSISSFRFVAVMIAQFIVQSLLLPMATYLGDGDKTLGFEKIMVIFSITGAIFFLITFITTKERIVPNPEQKSSVKQDISDLIKNKPWIIMLILTVFIFITLALKGGMYIYYFENYLSEPHISVFLQKIGFSNITNSVDYGFGLFNAGGIIFMIVGIAFSKGLADKYGKRDVFIVGLFFGTLAVFAFFFFPPQAIALVYMSQILHGFFYGLTIPLLWAMIADVADFSEWKNNRRATAIIFSAMILGLKVGLSIGGALVAWILSKYGYIEPIDGINVIQSAETLKGIKLSVSIYPSLTFLIGVISLFFYEINKKKEIQIEMELLERRINTDIILKK